MNQSNTFDQEIMEAMHFRRWLDIKACLKQNAFWEKRKKTDEGYDPTQKYRLVWDVMTHNMNQVIDKGGLDLTLDETTWPNSSYADIQGHLQGKKTDKGGQHVLLLDSKRRFIYAWTPGHKFFEVVHPFTATGPAEVTFGGQYYTSCGRRYPGSYKLKKASIQQVCPYYNGQPLQW